MLLVGGAYVGCAPVHALVVANRSTDQFRASADSRVFYEPGAEAMARVVIEALPSAIRDVEGKMFGPFSVPVRIYVCASIETFTSYGAHPRAGGLTVNHRVFLSPKPENTAERAPRLLRHELTHLHLGQQRGLLSFSKLPVWFVEGLAVDVSGGAGAESVSDAEARRAIAEGHSFVPDPDEGVWARKGATVNHLPQHMFYRQAGMFVSYLRSLDHTRFRAMLAQIEDGVALGDAFRNAHGKSIADAWQSFTKEAKSSR